MLRLARNLREGELLIDAGVFDGTDWSLQGILAGATVLGFEPLKENRRLIDDRLPVRLSEHSLSRKHSFLEVPPGEPVPLRPWRDVFQGAGHSYIVAAALGERVRKLNMTTRYDYSSISDQGYLTGPPNMEVELIAMTTLDDVIYDYLPYDRIQLLKLDVEGATAVEGPKPLRGHEELIVDRDSESLYVT